MAATLALGIAAAVVAGTVTYSQTRDDASAIGSTTRATTNSYEHMRFIEANMQLPAGPAISLDEQLFQREADYLNQLAFKAAQREAAHARLWKEFYELNQIVESKPVVPDYRLQEINILPGDDNHLLPFGKPGESY